MSFFPHAQEFTINDGFFTSIEGNVHYNVHVGHNNPRPQDEDFARKGIEILFQNAVTSASHDAEQRFPPPKCHPGTRSQVLETLRNWIRSKSRKTSVYWLSGAVGVGKSAIAQTISETFSTSRLAASFFFSRTNPSRNNLSHFFITIAHQLATSPLSSLILKNSIALAAYHRPDIIHASLETQFQELIMQPCNQLSPEQIKILPRLIVIDGLDECIDITSQERLLAIIRQAKTTAQPPLPFVFLISSRPEPRIRNAFRHKEFRSILDWTELTDSAESGKDIAKYLREEFSAIRKDHGPTMAHVALDWPGEQIIRQLVHKACGQFIYAATVLKYVGDHRTLPTERLKIILNVAVPKGPDSPYPDLDLLYMLILDSAIQKQKSSQLFLYILAHILNISKEGLGGPVRGAVYFDSSSRSIERLFALSKGKVGTLLFGLHSVLNIPKDHREDIQVRHASFGDFLTDRKRSERYFVDTMSKAALDEQYAFYLLRRVSMSVKRFLASFLSSNPRSLIHFMEIWYCDSWYRHCLRVKLPSRRLFIALDKIDTQRLRSTAWRGGCQDWFDACGLVTRISLIRGIWSARLMFKGKFEAT